jgi:hypothetical protein
MLEVSWTLQQWEAVRWSFELDAYERMAERIGLRHAGVQKRLSEAHGQRFDAGTKAIEARISSTPP